MRKLGFGCMRLPMNGDAVDTATFSKMVDLFLRAGFCYFDTAHGYLGGKSETALRECLTSRYPREAYLLTDKLTDNYFTCEADIRPLFERQLAACGVSYFDYYLMHAQTAELHEKYTACGAYRVAAALRAEGKIRHIGISFHDKADVLERILTERPEIEVVQIQLNYADADDPIIEGRKCHAVCRRFNKPVIVMEPVKGGILCNLPEAAKRVLDGLSGGSYASYAIRYAASFEGVMTVLSGMGSEEQVIDNTSYMKAFQPLSEPEQAAIDRVCEIFREQKMIPCTACRYCTDGCPARIAIPDLFACLNAKKLYGDWNSEWYYGVYTKNAGKASDCVRCGACERACPQHLPIRKLLPEVAAEFEKRPEAAE